MEQKPPTSQDEWDDYEPTDADILGAQLDGLFDDAVGDVTAEALESDLATSTQTIRNRYRS